MGKRVVVATCQKCYFFVVAQLVVLELLGLGTGLRQEAWAREWQSLNSEHFVVNYTRIDYQIAQSILEGAESAYGEITADIGYTPKNPTIIYIAPSRKVFERMTGSIQKWAIGCTFSPPQEMIILQSPKAVKGISPNLQYIIRHEYTHILLGQAIGNNLPRWLNEGLAMYEERRWRLMDEINIGEAVLSDSLLSFEELESQFPSDEKRATLAYAECFTILSYIMKNYGREGLNGLIKELSAKEEIDVALQNSLGIGIWDLENNWREHLKRRWIWVITLTTTTALWVILPFICIIAYMRKRRQVKRKLKEWEQEDGDCY